MEWQDRAKGLFQVQIVPAELPLCTSSEVARVLEQVVRGKLFGATLKAIDRHREVRYDARAEVRYGECVVHTDAGDVPMEFSIEWQNRKRGLFQVKAAAAPR